MKVILKQDVERVGRAGQVVDVSPGFSRNYLIPRGFAIPATAGSLAQVEHRKRLVTDALARKRRAAIDLKERIEAVACRITREAGEEDRLFGSVTARDIAAAMAEEGFQIDHRAIQIEHPIKHLGIYNVEVKLAPEVTARVKVWVVARE